MQMKRSSPKGAPFGVVDGVKHKTTEAVAGTANQTVRLDLGTKDALGHSRPSSSSWSATRRRSRPTSPSSISPATRHRRKWKPMPPRWALPGRPSVTRVRPSCRRLPRSLATWSRSSSSPTATEKL